MQTGAGSHNIEEKLKPIYKRGATVPSDGATGYVRGYLWVKTNGAAGTTLYVNEGDETSADFNVFETGALPSNVALLDEAQEFTEAQDFSAGITADTVGESTAATGVTVDGVLLKDGEVTTDTINEETAEAGVTVDGVLLKDGGVTTVAGAYLGDSGAISALLNVFAASANVIDLTTGFKSMGFSVMQSSDVVNLKAATVGMVQIAIAQTVSGTAPQINPDNADTIFINGAEQAVGKYVSPGAIGDWIVLVCYTAGKWIALVDKNATWTVET